MDAAGSAGNAPAHSSESWRAPALDVRGPRGRGPRGADGPADAGDLWIAGNALYFAGSASAWSVPLNWLGVPETGLDGVTTLPVRSADRARTISLRLARGVDDERALAAAVRRARVQRPDARDLRALDDVLQFTAPELRRLEEEATALDNGADAAGLRAHGAHATATAARLRELWLPYWGDAATRLRDATVGALQAVADASTGEQGADADARCEQAVRRWRNVVDDLRAWCGAPSEADTPPAPRRPGMAQPAARATPAPSPVPAATPSPANVPEPTPPAAPPPVPVASAPPPESAAPAPTIMVTRPATPADVPPEPAFAPPPAPVQPSPLGAPQPAFEAPAPPQPATPAPSPLGAQIPVPAAAPLNAPPPAAPTPPAVQQVAPTPAPVEPPADAVHGSGEMTRLYRRVTPTGVVARKVLTPDEAAKPSVSETFLQLGRRFQGVEHPSLVRIYDVGRDRSNATPYIDMEWVEGESLGTRAGRGPMAQELALRILAALAEAIDTLHFAGVVHGDIRPHNVLLDPSGRVVLLEPSIACDHALEEERGQVFGDPPYLTPEHARGDEPVARSDVYGLGALAFLLLSGRPPFNGSPEDVFSALLDSPAPTLASVVPGTPAEASDALAASLSKLPEDRPASAVAFIGALRRALQDAGASTPPTERIVRATPPAAQTPPQQPSPAPAEQRPPPSPLGRAAPSPLGGAPSPLGSAPAAPSPLGNPPAPPAPRSGPPSQPSAPPPPDDDSDDGVDRTIIVRPRE